MHTFIPLCVLSFLVTPLLAQTGTYTTFGNGCPSSVDVVVPLGAAKAWGNTANAFPVGTGNQRWQQEIDASQMPSTSKSFFGMGWREDNANRVNASRRVKLRILFGMTKYTSSNLTDTFGTNATGKQTLVFSGTMSVPAVPGGNQNLKTFHYFVKFSRPYVYTPAKGQSFLIEVINGSTKPSVRRLADAVGGSGTPGSRVYANRSQTASKGRLEKNHMMVMAFETSAQGRAPLLSSTGFPAINKSFSVELSGATRTSAAGLILGVSKTKWGALTLPLDLTAAGGTGCSLLVSFDHLIAVPVIAGSGSFKFPIPNSAGLVGDVFHNQFFVLDKAANALGLSFTNGGTGKIGK